MSYVQVNGMRSERFPLAGCGSCDGLGQSDVPGATTVGVLLPVLAIGGLAIWAFSGTSRTKRNGRRSRRRRSTRRNARRAEANTAHPADERQLKKHPRVVGAYLYRGFLIEDRKHRHTIGGDHAWIASRRGISLATETTRAAAIAAVDAYWSRLGR